MSRSRASVLVAMLWCVALLSMIVIGVLHTARMDLLVVKNQGDAIQARYLALAGIEKAKALIHLDAASRKGIRKNHSGALEDAPDYFRNVALGRGGFSVFRQARADEGGGIKYGIDDEESRLNVNLAQADALAKLEGMTPDVIASILDWRDGDDTATAGGAEAEYYSSLQPPYLPRNSQLQSIRELLLVSGITRELLFGEDANANGLLDPEEDDGDLFAPRDNRDGILNAGWSAALTTESSVRNVNAAGEERVNVQSAGERELSRVPGISTELAKAIVAYRGQKQLNNLADLLDVTPVNPANQPRPPGGPGQAIQPTGQSGAPAGPKLIDEQLFMDIADDVAVTSDEEQGGAININTASAIVLACLPGVDQQLAEAIVRYRKSAGFFPNIAWLLKVDGMSRDIFRQLAPRVTARSETFRIISEGTVTSTGTRKRMEVVVHLRAGGMDTLAYREDL